MNIITTKAKLRTALCRKAKKGSSVGFVPTMGCLHAGHISLIRRARKENDVVVVSIFVNPLQFGLHEDYHGYPRTAKEDEAICSDEDVDILYMPHKDTFYPEPFLTSVRMSTITECLCGESRPGHFDGVATVVLKLFAQLRPTRAYFGQKDYQQLMVIKQLVCDLDLDVKIIGCPIIREADGLAMSSRNRYLSDDERGRATILNQALCKAQEWIKSGVIDGSLLKVKIKNFLRRAADTIDYVEIRDAQSLAKITTCKGKVVIALAAYFGKARLIDNIVINV